jgi:hypothetical protein
MKNLGRMAIVMLLVLMLGMTVACDVPEDGAPPPTPPSGSLQ